MTASATFALAMLGLAGFASPAAALAGDTIMVTTAIQAAVDTAQPGDTILVLADRAPRASDSVFAAQRPL